MAFSSEILSFCHTLLKTSTFEDYCYNGLQVAGKPKVSRIALGVSASKAFLEESANWNADLCLVHHGLIFGKIDRITDILAGRLEILLKNHMGLAGFHLPLDAHETVGNNIAIAELLELENIKKCDIGWSGELPQKMDFMDFVRLVEESLGTKASFAENFGTPQVNRIAIISGGASDYSRYAIENEADTFVFGELKESAYHELKERGINFIAAGHFATERLGIQRLGAAIHQKFPEVEIKFFDEEVEI
ncbi:MAG: Nif3-like dinuclear metal center hexameric protein [Candidatus Peregrinibacteria bacterium]